MIPAEQSKPPKPPQHLLRVLLPFILVAATVIVVSLTSDGTVTMPGENPTPQDTTAPEDTPQSGAAPEPLSPPDGIEFVDAAPALEWDWPAELADDQLFAVRVWYGDESPRETWTVKTRFDAADAIDSFRRETGPFYWQVAVIVVDDDGDFVSMASEWSPVQTLQRVRS